VTGEPRSVLISGAGTGLGLVTALHLAERRFRVYATAPRETEREAIADAARARGLEVRTLHLDITDAGSIQEAVSAVVADAGGIYALVNNAGVRLRGCFEDLLDAEIRRLFAVNVFGTMELTRAVLPHMRAARNGRIVMITSVGGRIGSFGVSAYCSTKFAQEGFGESLAQEVAPFGIKVVMLEPAIIRTEAWSTNRVLGERACDPASPYATWFRRAEHLADAMVRSSPTRPEHVAVAVHRVLVDASPPLREVIGRRARVVMALRRYVPDRLFERFYFGQVVRRVTGPAGTGGEDGALVTARGGR
jgi:NAD(P)-dependent dehydrogenase (short-subunit alcohol dehydrogenase family)